MIARPHTTSTRRPPWVARLRRTLTKITAMIAMSDSGNAALTHEERGDPGFRYAWGSDRAALTKVRERATMARSSAARRRVAN